mgnify:FL=1
MKSTLRRTWAEIDLDAIRHNYEALRRRIGEDVKFLGVVKADAYGHGAVHVARTLQELGADYLGVSSLDEAMELRANGIVMPILILGHTPTEQVPNLIANNITQTVTCLAKAHEYNAAAAEFGAVLRVHMKVDTGMSRLGVLCAGRHFDTGIDGIVDSCNMPNLDVEGIFTHFAVADETDENDIDYTKRQFELFKATVSAVEQRLGHRIAIRHCANTGAVAQYPETYVDMVRPGLLLYGCGEFAQKLGLRPAMALKAMINTIKIYDEGTDISYGRMYRTTSPTRIGVIPYGYADGFFRCLSNRCSIMTASGPAPQRGRICMDMSMIDLSELPGVGVGDEVEIFGPHNPVETLAELAGTIPYELICAVSKRVPRVYYKDGREIDRELLLRF